MVVVKKVKASVFFRSWYCRTHLVLVKLAICEESIIQGDSEISLEKKCGVSLTQNNSA
jgi:hypothetical protein